MRVKVINSNLSDYGKEFKVRRMNYDQVVVNYPGVKGINVFNKIDLEFITESEVDKFLIKYNDFLKIKLNRGISVTLYKAILDAIENELSIDFENLNLLKDEDLSDYINNLGSQNILIKKFDDIGHSIQSENFEKLARAVEEFLITIN